MTLTHMVGVVGKFVFRFRASLFHSDSPEFAYNFADFLRQLLWPFCAQDLLDLLSYALYNRVLYQTGIRILAGKEED